MSSSRLNDIPVYERVDTHVPAVDFNRVQIALKRLGGPLRIPLAGLRSLQLILEPEAWIVVDTALNEVPVFAWTEFQTAGRIALHEPIACVLKAYHAHYGVIFAQVTQCMEKVLAERLAELYDKAGAKEVVNLPGSPQGD
jgi:hypothetical protein